MNYFIIGVLIMAALFLATGCAPEATEVTHVRDACPDCGHPDRHASFYASMPCTCGSTCVHDCTCPF